MATVLEPAAEPVTVSRSRFADYVELTKPRIATMALVTVAAGYFLGAAPVVHADLLFHTLLGAWMVAAGGGALNHWLERRIDGRMVRTADRPLPSGRVSATEAFLLGTVLGFGGVAYLWLLLPSPAAAICAGLTFLMYIGIYTPMKRITTWNTVIGAIPGALPPVIGWAGAKGTVSPEAWSLFAILFVWQLPHFYSIAWLYREDYARGGYQMLPVLDHSEGRLTGGTTAATCAVLLAVTAAPFAVGTAGWVYLLGAMPLGVWFLMRGIRFAKLRTNPAARTVLRGSIVYLLGVMTLLVLDGILPRYLG